MPEAIVVRRFHFDAAHYLPDHPGPCKNLHGHRWEVEVGVKGRILGGGMVIDFGDLKKLMHPIVGPASPDNPTTLDHSLLNDRFGEATPPTAEVIAWSIRNTVVGQLSNSEEFRKSNLVVEFVRVWETPDAYAEVR